MLSCHCKKRTYSIVYCLLLRVSNKRLGLFCKLFGGLDLHVGVAMFVQVQAILE